MPCAVTFAMSLFRCHTPGHGTLPVAARQQGLRERPEDDPHSDRGRAAVCCCDDGINGVVRNQTVDTGGPRGSGADTAGGLADQSVSIGARMGWIARLATPTRAPLPSTRGPIGAAPNPIGRWMGSSP